MLSLTLGQTSENIIVTLTEKRTLDAGYYLFVFTHYTTKQVVTKIYNFLDDDSGTQDRFNQFEINTHATFSAYNIGMWNYEVYEQESDTNTDPTGLTKLEDGILMLNSPIELDREVYNESQSYRVYKPLLAIGIGFMIIGSTNIIG